MPQLLASARRDGLIRVSAPVSAGQTAVDLTFTPDLPDLATAGLTTVTVLVEQSADGGATWFTLGGFGPTSIQSVGGLLKNGAGETILNRQTGLPDTQLRLSLTEEIRRADLVGSFETVHEYTLRGQTYKQYAMLGTMRVTITTDKPLIYSLDAATDARRRF